MIKFSHSIYHYSSLIEELFSCDCIFDQVFFLIKKEEEDFVEIIEEKLKKKTKEDGFMINFFDGTLILICMDVLKFIRRKKGIKLFRDICTLDIISCKKDKIRICSICCVDVFRKLDVLHHYFFEK